MIGVPGTAQRLFGALREAGVSVMMISQGSSEHSICFAVPENAAEQRAPRRRARVRGGARAGQIQRVDVTTGLRDPRGRRRRHGRHAGHRRRSCSARSAPPASTCARSRRARRSATSPSSSTRKDSARALRAVHAGFYLSPQTISIGVIGPGMVGGALLEQIARAAAGCASGSTSTCACARSPSTKRMLLEPQRIDLDHWRDALAARHSRSTSRSSSSTCRPTTCRTR